MIDLTTLNLGRRRPISNLTKEQKFENSKLTMNDTWRRNYKDVDFVSLNLQSELMCKNSFRIGL